MKKEVNNQSIEVIKDVLRQYLKDKGLRNTPERYTILEEIYTIYNTIEVFLDAGLIRKHQFGEGSTYEKSYFDKQHDHLVLYKSGSDKEIEEIIEFCDPRIQAIKDSIENIFNVKIDSHTLYFFGQKKED